MSRRFMDCACAAMVIALLFAGAGASARQAASTGKKSHVASSSRHTTKGRRSSKHTRTGVRRRVHYYVPRVSAAHRAEMIERIGDRLKEPEPHAIAYQSALAGFYAQLASYQRERKDPGTETTTLRVLQFGDSHTAADEFTGEARRVFQQQFGDGGVGFSYAGHPFAGYRILGSQHQESPGWTTEGNKFLHFATDELGMGGLSISTDRAGEWISLDTTCSALQLQYLEQPGGGGLRFTDNDGDPVEIQTASDAVAAGTFNYNCTPGDHVFRVTTEQDAPVALLGWVTTQPGVTWECLGINGAEAPLMLRWDQQLFSSYLKDNSPALIVLAYGTNEAASSSWDEESYRAAFASIVDDLHNYVPESSILVVGPPDRSVIHHHAWRDYTGTDRIIEAQKAVCRTHGCAYWDQRARMGGAGSMQQWTYAGWAQPDHTHFTGEGYRELADALMADMMAGYHAYRDDHAPASETTAQGAADGPASPNP